MLKLKMNKEIYSLSNVCIAVRAYSHLANIIYEDEERYWVLTFSDCLYDETLTSREFENYMIGLENN